MRQNHQYGVNTDAICCVSKLSGRGVCQNGSVLNELLDFRMLDELDVQAATSKHNEKKTHVARYELTSSAIFQWMNSFPFVSRFVQPRKGKLNNLLTRQA